MSFSLLVVSIIPTVLLTSCNEDKYTETSMEFSETNFEDYLDKNHTVFNEQLDSYTSDGVKDYFFKHNRITGKNLIYTVGEKLATKIGYVFSGFAGANVKFGYNSNSCYIKLESDFTINNGYGETIYKKDDTFVEASVNNNHLKLTEKYAFLQFSRTVENINTNVCESDLNNIYLKLNT
jgi:hypothetical protein